MENNDTAPAISNKVEEKLKATGVISSSDLAQFQTQVAEEEAAAGPSLDESLLTETVIQLDPPADKITPQVTPVDMSSGFLMTVLLGTATLPTIFEGAIKAARECGAHVLTSPEELKITPGDKLSFVDSLVDDTRWTTQINLFGGRLRVKLRSRTSEESAAIMAELNRRHDRGEFNSMLDYGAALRGALLYFQIASINDIDYPAHDAEKDPLRSSVSWVGAKAEILTPTWAGRASSMLKGNEGRERAIFQALLVMEYKYWELTKQAESRSFWNPVEPT